jgi:tetraacyldisaccharide 4'-kinase
MDDGFQNNSFKKDFSILVIDDEAIGNGFVMPAGPLREPFSIAERRADLVLNLGKIGKKTIPDSEKVVRGEVKVIDETRFIGQKYVAFCSIANPKRFLDGLRNLKIEVLEKFIFADHSELTERRLLKIIDSAKKNHCKVITTSKDFVKIPINLKHYFVIVEIEVLSDFDFFDKFIDREINNKRR